MADARSWLPEYRCHWCGESFVQREVDRVRAWTCPTDACYERQIAWKMVDKSRKLFYLPLPRLVQLEETVASQQYGAICLGGDRSGGKSVGLRMLIYRYASKLANFMGLILRRNFTELELNHMRFAARDADRMGWIYSEQKKTLKFPDNDGVIQFGHCWKPSDFAPYIGGDVDLIYFGQLEQFTAQQFVEISPSTGRIRRDEWRGLVLAEENPGGPLSSFVAQFFITKNPDAAQFPHYRADDHHFIASRLEDNPWSDPRYVHKLANLSPERRAMMRFGARDTWPGKFFVDFDPATHVSPA